jgi:hypothetical protein
MKMECQPKIEKILNKGMELGKKILYVIIFTLIIPFTACSEYYYCDRLKSTILSQCGEKEDNCTVTFKESFAFDWDTLYMFDSMLYPDEVSSALGFDCDCNIVPENKRLVVFARKGEAIKKYMTECNNNIGFYRTKENGVIKISRSSIFRVDKSSYNNEVYYFLYEI